MPSSNTWVETTHTQYKLSIGDDDCEDGSPYHEIPLVAPFALVTIIPIILRATLYTSPPSRGDRLLLLLIWDHQDEGHPPNIATTHTTSTSSSPTITPSTSTPSGWTPYYNGSLMCLPTWPLGLGCYSMQQWASEHLQPSLPTMMPTGHTRPTRVTRTLPYSLLPLLLTLTKASSEI